MVPSPAWASKWHRLSFNKIAALSFTQFRKVVVLDNDVGLLRSMDHMLLHAPAPAAVFHTTIGPLAKRTPCAVTTGLLVLRPSQRAFARARRYDGNSRKSTSRRRTKDDSFGDAISKVIIKELKGTTGRRIVRGILGGLFKGK